MSKGFTLIELLIVVFIVAVLSTATIVYYQGYIEEARKTEAVTYIGKLVQEQKIYYEKNLRYFEGVSQSDHWSYTIRQLDGYFEIIAIERVTGQVLVWPERKE